MVNYGLKLLMILFRPPFIFGYDPSFSVDGQYYLAGGIVFAGSVILQSNVYILLRMLKNIHFSVTLLVFGVVGVLESLGKIKINPIVKNTNKIFCFNPALFGGLLKPPRTKRT